MTGAIQQLPNAEKPSRRRWIVILIVSLLAIVASVLALRWERAGELQDKSEEQITRILLDETPRGTSKELVLGFVKSKGWGMADVSVNREHPVDRICRYLGQSNGVLLHDRVYAEWIFDDEKRLLDVHVYKFNIDLP